MASVFGPLEAKIQKELSDRMLVEVYYKPKVGMPGKKTIQTSTVCVTVCYDSLMCFNIWQVCLSMERSILFKLLVMPF